MLTNDHLILRLGALAELAGRMQGRLQDAELPPLQLAGLLVKTEALTQALESLEGEMGQDAVAAWLTGAAVDSDPERVPPKEADGRSHCPRCGWRSHYTNVGSTHYGMCDHCMVYWCIGSNLFSSWEEETPEDWERSKQTLSRYAPLKEAADLRPADLRVVPGEEDIPF
jgi:hypothetical protein